MKIFLLQFPKVTITCGVKVGRSGGHRKMWQGVSFIFHKPNTHTQRPNTFFYLWGDPTYENQKRLLILQVPSQFSEMLGSKFSLRVIYTANKVTHYFLR